MSGAAAQYEQRGGLLRPLHALSDSLYIGDEPQSHSTTATTAATTEHDYRFPRRPPPPTTASGSSAVARDKLDPSGANGARKDLLRESIFPTWKDDAAGEELDSPDEMQRRDPLATQIWRLYSKTKKQLPNQERMENLTWRMMAMSLRKRREEAAGRYVQYRIHESLWGCHF